MSWDAIEFAFKQNIKPASLKFLLVAFADNINKKDVCYGFPSIKALCDKTGMNRKTVISGLSSLEKLGFISDTKNRAGRTGQVKVYRINGLSETDPISEPLHGETIPVTVQLNNTDNGTISMPNSPVFTQEIVKESRFYAERVPKTGHGTSNVTSNIKLTSNKKEKDLSPTALSPPEKKEKLSFENIPPDLAGSFSRDVVNAFVAHRKALRKPLTPHALNLNLREAIESWRRGVAETPDDAINQTILAGWLSVNHEYLKNRLDRGQKNETGSYVDNSAPARVARAIAERRRREEGRVIDS